VVVVAVGCHHSVQLHAEVAVVLVELPVHEVGGVLPRHLEGAGDPAVQEHVASRGRPEEHAVALAHVDEVELQKGGGAEAPTIHGPPQTPGSHPAGVAGAVEDLDQVAPEEVHLALVVEVEGGGEVPVVGAVHPGHLHQVVPAHETVLPAGFHRRPLFVADPGGEVHLVAPGQLRKDRGRRVLGFVEGGAELLPPSGSGGTGVEPSLGALVFPGAYPSCGHGTSVRWGRDFEGRPSSRG